jgi:integrase/recombinase XerC
LVQFINYVKNEKRLSSHTVNAYQNDLEQFKSYVAETFQIDPRQSTYHMVRSWIVKLSEEEKESTTINRKIACLRSYFKYLMRQDIIERSPMVKIKVLKVKKTLPSFVTEKEIINLLDGVQYQDFRGIRDKLVLELLYGTGMRLSEMINLKVTDINFINNTIKVLGKRNKERIIPIPGKLKTLIEAYIKIKPKSEYLVLTDEGEKAYPMLVQRLVKKYLGTYSNTEKKSPHVLRHTYATHLLDKGANLNAIKDLLGHGSLAATQVYTHNSIEKLKKIFAKSHPKA